MANWGNAVDEINKSTSSNTRIEEEAGNLYAQKGARANSGAKRSKLKRVGKKSNDGMQSLKSPKSSTF